MIKSSIRNRLFILFVWQIVLVLFLAGFYLQWHLGKVLEDELSEKLQSIAAVVASQIETELILELIPGDEETRNYNNLRQALLQIQIATGMKRLFIFDPNKRSLLDTEPYTRIGAELPRLKADLAELEQVFAGSCASSVLFIGNDGYPYKTGYAPLILNSQVAGAVGVEGSAVSLNAIKEIRKILIQIGVIAVLMAGFMAFIFSNRLTLPLRKLQSAARRIGRGDLTQAIDVKGSDEITFLGQTLEEMRRGILTRDDQQKQMLASVAHEIRNPLGGMELFAGLLIEELAQSQSQSKAEKILREVRNLKRLIQNFLDYARPVTPKRQKCRVMDCWQEVQTLLMKDIESKQIAIQSTGDAEIFADPQQIKQILMNLASNSIAAIDSMGRIEIETRMDGKKVIVHFSDSGSGIPAEIRDHIFIPFYTTKDKGTGLGLAIVKNLVSANGGWIRLVDQSKTTTFEIILPGFEL